MWIHVGNLNLLGFLVASWQSLRAGYSRLNISHLPLRNLVTLIFQNEEQMYLRSNVISDISHEGWNGSHVKNIYMFTEPALNVLVEREDSYGQPLSLSATINNLRTSITHFFIFRIFFVWISECVFFSLWQNYFSVPIWFLKELNLNLPYFFKVRIHISVPYFLLGFWLKFSQSAVSWGKFELFGRI
jgi:hypothetical protein